MTQGLPTDAVHEEMVVRWQDKANGQGIRLGTLRKELEEGKKGVEEGLQMKAKMGLRRGEGGEEGKDKRRCKGGCEDERAGVDVLCRREGTA